jgi:protein ImuA
MLPTPAVTDQAPTLNALLDRPGVWRGRPSRRHTEVLDSGFTALNGSLHQGGWPASGLVELLCAGPCPQALRLLLPVMAGNNDGLLVLANPPARPRADTLQQAGIPSHRLLVMRSERQDTLLQACHEALSSGAVSVLVVWLPERMDDQTSLRRLHLAAREGNCLLVAIRAVAHADRPSPAVLRLRLRVQPPAHLGIDIIKQPGGWGGQQLSLALMPERLSQPLAASCDMPPPPRLRERQTSTLAHPDPDSRFAWRRPAAVAPGLRDLPF